MTMAGVLKKLKENDCFYMKSDKGRDLVIMDRADYIGKMTEITLASNFKYTERDPVAVQLNGDSWCRIHVSPKCMVYPKHIRLFSK